MIPLCILVIENDDDREFMSMLFTKYNRLMYHEIYRILHDSWAAEDVMQTTIEKLIDKVTELRVKDRDHLVNYIISASRNHAKNYLRDQGRYEMLSFDDETDLPDVEHSGDEMDFRLIRENNLDILSRVWPQLDERSQYLLEGRYLLEKTVSELSQELGIKPASVRMALSRARKTAYQLMVDKIGVV